MTDVPLFVLGSSADIVVGVLAWTRCLISS